MVKVDFHLDFLHYDNERHSLIKDKIEGKQFDFMFIPTIGMEVDLDGFFHVDEYFSDIINGDTLGIYTISKIQVHSTTGIKVILSDPLNFFAKNITFYVPYDVGNYAKCQKVHLQYKKCLTEGKYYEIIEVYRSSNEFRHDIDAFYIIDDNGKKKKYDIDNSQFYFLPKSYCSIS